MAIIISEFELFKVIMNSQVMQTFLATFLLLAIAAASQPADLNLESLCSNKHIELTKRSQVRVLVEQLRKEPENACSDRVRSALVELDELINDSSLSDVCSLEHVEKIKVFYEKYIAQSLTNANNNEAESSIELPTSLKSFALSYGLKVSSLCKKNMINSLEYESHQLLEPEDFEHINPWTDEKSAISQIMNEPTDYDDLLLPRDIERVLRDWQANPNELAEGAPSDEKIFLQTATGHLIERTQAVCERRFKPIYEQLIMPLIYLSNLGFNYQGEDLEREMKEMRVNKQIHQWYRIVYLCESMNGIEIVEDPNDSEKTEGTDKRLVRILTKEEAAKLMDEEKKLAPKAEGQEEPKQVVFKPEYGNKLEDQVIDTSDRNFMKLLRSFATHKNELDRIRAKLLKKMAKFLFQILRRGQFKLIGSIMGNKQQSESGNANDDMVKLLDDYVSQATSSGEAPVAGLGSNKVGGVAKRMYHQAAYHGVSGITSKVKKNTFDKAMINRYFWYVISLALFICGISLLLG